MSTTLLNRRMDLIHTSTNAINTLKMDTSYPVRLSGIVIKVFQAIANYSNINPNTGSEFSDATNLFFVQNQEGASVTTIQKQNVFDFAGKKLKNDEYITGDYVLAIIDINNNKIFIHSLQNATGIGRDDPTYTKDMDYHCNGINDNTVLGGISNILIDLYDYSQNINYVQDEFTYSITNANRQDIFPYDRFTINIIGKFGIDYSATDFVYPSYSNRQNRSIIMKIAGTLYRGRVDNIDIGSEKDLEMVFDWTRCYIPKINYNNETFAAMYNTKLDHLDENGDPIYYDYWTHENTAHFTNSTTGKAYGNLFPRRLIFASIEGALPINVTFKNFVINTFCTAIYSQTESKKTIKLQNSKITINGSYSDVNIPNGDITNNKSFYRSMPAPYGCGLDINAWNPTVIIDNCEIKNANDCKDSNLIINSCSNMIVTNSIISDFNNSSDGYKIGYTRGYLDFERFLDYEYSTEYILNKSIDPTYDLSNPNTIESIIALNSFYKKGNLINVSNNSKDIAMVNPSYTMNMNVPILGTHDIMDFSSTPYEIDYDNRTISYYNYTAKSKSGIDNCRTFGALKNIPVLYHDNPEDSKCLGLRKTNTPISPTNLGVGSDDVYIRCNNRESLYMPKLSISDSSIMCSGILFQYNAKTNFNNCVLSSKMFDHRYYPHPIHLLSGELTINNCECSFDTRNSKYFIGHGTANNNKRISYIKVYNNLIAEPSNNLNTFDMDTPSIVPLSSTKLNIIGSRITLIPDISYNTISNNCTKYSSNTLVFHNNRKDGCIKQTYNSMSLSYINSSIYTIDKDNPSFFNPSIAPNINIESSEFLINDTYSTSENYKMGGPDELPYLGDVHKLSALSIVVRVGTIFDTILEDNSKYTTSVSSLPTSDNIYKNYINAVRIQKYNHNGTSVKYIDRIFDISTGIVTTYVTDINDNVTKEESTQFDLSACTTNKSKLKKMEMFNDENLFYLYEKAAYLNGDTNCTLDSNKNITNANGTFINKNNIENHIIICYIYGADLPQTGYYIYKSIRDLLNDNTVDSLNDIESIYNNFGVTAFELENTVFNMSNSNIGSGMNYVGARNTYGMETFVRRSPRICFNFKSAGIYKISNTNANAWGTVLWSTLNKNARKAYDNYKTGDYRIPAPFDYSTLTQHNYGSLVIDNCNFKNYSALRFKETSEDWMDYLDSNYNIRLDANLYKKEIYDKNNFGYSLTNETDKNELRLQKSVLNQTRQKYSRAVDEVPQYDYYVEDFNETIRNANEMPVMYINNTNLINTLINNSNLNGNESIIVQGNVKFNGCTYINLGNGILCYIGYSLYELANHPEWYSVSKLTVKDCNLIAIKDVMYDSYIDHDLRRVSNDDISTYGSINGNMYTFEEQCMNKGMIKYDNVITSFFIESDKVQTEFKGNTFISKCNSYNSIYSLHDYVRTRLIYFNSGDSQTDNTLIFKDNNVSMIYGCPEFYNITYTHSLRSLLSLRLLPSSTNYTVIDFNNNTYGNNKKSVLISNNKFDIKTLINNKTTVAIELGSTDPVTSILNSIPSFYTPEQYIIYKEECIVEDKRNSNGDILEIKYKGIYNINKTIIEDNRDRCYDSTIFTKNISDTKLINPFDVSLEAGSPNTGVSNTFEDYIIDDDVMYKCIPIDNISDFTNKEYHDSISNQDGTTSYYYNTSRYVISNSKIKKSSSANDYNFMYAKFNTPILKSNNFINANIYGNIICNSDPSLSNEDIYTLSSDETISTLHSSCIIDVYEDNNVSLLEPYKININNNIFTDSNPKGILISTENIKREDDGTIWKMYSMGENGYIFNQFLCIQEILNNVVHRYFKYSNFSELYKKTMYKNGYPVDGESYKKYIDTKSYSIKVNDTTEDNLRDNVFFNDVSHSIQLSHSDNNSNTYNTLYAYADRFSNNNGNLLFYSGKMPSNINTDTKHYNYIHYINLETLDNYLMDILTNNNRLNIDNELSFIDETLIFYIESSEFNYCMCKCNILPCFVSYNETEGETIINHDASLYYFNTVDYSRVAIKTTSLINVYKYIIENERYETIKLGSNSVLNINLSKIVCIYGSSPTASHPNYMISLDTTYGVYYITLESLKNYYDNGAIIINNHQEIYSGIHVDGLPIDKTSKMFTYSQTKINKGDKFYYKYELTDTNYHGESDTIIIPYKNKYDIIKLENCALLKTRIPNYNFVLPGTTKESLETMFEIFNDINCITLEMKYNSNTYRCDIYFNELPDLYFTYADNEVILSDDELVNNKPYLNNVMYNSYLVNPIQIGIINNGNNLLPLGDKISVLDETSYYSDMIAENTGVRLNTSNNNYKVNSGYYNQNNKDTNSKKSTLNKLRTDLNNEYSDIT